MIKKIKFFTLFLSFLGVFLLTSSALATDFGTAAVNTGLAGSLTSSDPRLLIGKIIQIALSFLGVIAVIIIMYAGFIWMSSDGDEEKISKAKKILKDALIGLVIILSSWGITTFILAHLTGAINGSNQNPVESGTSGFSNPGIGVIGSCTILNTYPSNGQRNVARNTSMMISFKEKLKLDQVCLNNANETCVCDNTSNCEKINPAAIRLYKTDLGDACQGISCPSSNSNSNETDLRVSISSDKKTLNLIPANYLGDADGDTPYTIKITNLIKKEDDSSMFSDCVTDYASWKFTVNNKVDLIPPSVSPASVSPFPDNLKDVFNNIINAEAAKGSITIKAEPQIYHSATLISLTPPGASVVLNYHGSLSEFRIGVPSGAPDKAQLSDSGGNLLGIADFDSQGHAVFPNFLSFTAANHPVGSLWDIKINPEKLADNLKINSIVYTFATSTLNNNIKVPNPFSTSVLAANIQAKINSALLVAQLNGSVINLSAKKLGSAGNDISITSTNPQAISIIPLSGGINQRELNKVQDSADRPMNTVIQINFSKPINPLVVSGTADEVYRNIKVVNFSASSSASGASCTNDKQCQSYKCSDGFCVGDYLEGKFMISNNYQTLEFTSDRECGINGCGEKIYCLPPNSHLKVELKAADLKSCKTNDDCLAYGSFNICSSTPLSAQLPYKTCQNSTGQNYPGANINNLNGVVGSSLNSLDGDRSKSASGPVDFYNDNYVSNSIENFNKKDGYEWSFYVSDKLDLSSPQIVNISPAQASDKASLTDPIKITFNKVMMNSSLKTGSIKIKSGNSEIEHHLINLSSSAQLPLGYWVSAKNLDIGSLNGNTFDTDHFDDIPDITEVEISHSALAPSATFRVQVGSGVKDIYQNCYKPSSGPNCTATAAYPSCCFGTATNVLNADGNCQ